MQKTREEMKQSHRNWIPLTVSVPSEMLAQLDYIRNDVTRSRYLQRVLNDHFKLMELTI
jgi:hypothetical protein